MIARVGQRLLTISSSLSLQDAVDAAHRLGAATPAWLGVRDDETGAVLEIGGADQRLRARAAGQDEDDRQSGVHEVPAFAHRGSRPRGDGSRDG